MAQENISILFTSEKKRALELYKEKAYAPALQLFMHVNDKKGFSEEVSLKIAQCLQLLNRPKEAELWLSRIVNTKQSEKNFQIRLLYADLLIQNGRYDLARKIYEKIILENPLQTDANNRLQSLNLLPQLFQDSLTFSISKLTINSPQSDFSPQYVGSDLVFLSSRNSDKIVNKVDASTQQGFLELYQSKFISKDTLSEPVKLKFLNSKWHDGPIAILNNGKKVIYTRNTTTTKAHGLSQLQMFFATLDLKQQTLSSIRPLPFNSETYSVSHPFFHEASQTLYFTSNMPDGFGGTDIYKSTLKNGKWTPAQNLGAGINTSGNEMFPYLFKDMMLCFSSSGHSGLGGLDVFYSLKSGEAFATPINVGYPINTSSDDFSLVFSPEGQEGYFASNRGGTNANDDLYKFKIKHTLLEGEVKDKLGLISLSEVTLNLIENNQLKESKLCTTDGLFYFYLKPGHTYQLEAIKNGYKIGATTIPGTATDKSIQHTIVLERKNKAFVKVTLLDENQMPISNGNLKIYERSKLEQTLITNDKGEARCEVDVDVENIFVAEAKGRVATHKLDMLKNSRGSMVLNVDLELKQYRAYDIEISIKNERTKKPLPGYEAQVKNVVTGEIITICSDQKGKFQFKGGSYTTYDIAINFGSKTSNLYGLHPKQDHSVEVYWDENN